MPMSFNLLTPTSLHSQAGFIVAGSSRAIQPTPRFPIIGTDLFSRKTLSAPHARKRVMIPEARLCDTKLIKNTIPYHQSKQFLNQLAPFVAPEAAALNREMHPE